VDDEVPGVHTLSNLQIEVEAFRAKVSIRSPTNANQYFSVSCVNFTFPSEHWRGRNLDPFDLFWNIL
jgi:hypothetical protein